MTTNISDFVLYFLTIIQRSYKLEGFLRIVFLDKIMIDITKFKLLYNLQV